MSTTCTVCGGKSDAYLCRACWTDPERGLENAFAQLPGLVHDVATRTARETHVYRANPRSAAPDVELAGLEEEYGWRRALVPPHLRDKHGRVTLPSTPDVADLTASTLLDRARTTLTTWARHLAETRGVDLALSTGQRHEGPVCAAHVHRTRTVGCQDQPSGCRRYHPEHRHYPSRPGCPDGCRLLHCAHASCARIRHGELTGTAAALVRWFLLMRESVRFDEAAAEIYADVTALRGTLARAVDRSPSPVSAGPCVVAACGAELSKYPGDTEIVCRGDASGNPGCDATYTAAERTTWLADHVEDELVTLDTLRPFVTSVMELRWPPLPTVRSWRFRGRLRERSIDRNGAELFRGGDVLDLVRDWNEREAQRHGKATA